MEASSAWRCLRGGLPAGWEEPWCPARLPVAAAHLPWDRQPRCPWWQPVSCGISSPGAHGGSLSPVGSAAPAPTVAARLLWDQQPWCPWWWAVSRGTSSPGAHCGLVLRTSVWPASSQAPCVACHKSPVHPRASSSSAPASLTAVQGAGGFPRLRRRGRRLAQAFSWQQQDLLGCSPGAPSSESGEEQGVMCWETEEEHCPLHLVLLGAWAHPWVLKHIPQITPSRGWNLSPPEIRSHHPCGIQGSSGVQQQGEDELAAPLLLPHVFSSCRH